MGAYKEAIEGLNLREMAKNFWKYEPPTPEEIETLEDCRRVNTYEKTKGLLLSIFLKSTRKEIFSHMHF